MKKLKAVIFDMDGLLPDTERIALLTFVEACRECHFDPDLEVYQQCIGTTYAKTAEIPTSGYGKDFPFNAVSRLWERKFEAETLDNPVPLKEGALNLLQYLEWTGVKKAAVTSTNQAHALGRLAKPGS